MSTFPSYDSPEVQQLIGNLTTDGEGRVGPFQELNVQFVLSSAYLVFFMHCGFAMVSAVPTN